MAESAFQSGNLSFTLAGDWQEDSNPEEVVYWKQTPGSVVEICVYPIEPEKAMPYGQDEKVISMLHEQSIDEDSGLIEVKSHLSPQGNFVHSLFKRKAPGSGPIELMYNATLFARFSDEAYSLQIRGKENGTTGIRDATVLNEMQARGSLDFIEDPSNGKGFMQGWNRDPYDENFVSGFLMNQSEDAQYDAQFPEHPLSVIRGAINSFVASSHTN